jgi:hypothetical protein
MSEEAANRQLRWLKIGRSPENKCIDR